ncbi:DUF4097 family beta strand repeat-containing protein [Hymenobacter sp. PAMC 26628]|uniref:DUF4097 family beta strand repeat-containing protein n=1 Tax=Hymenobacter sp. PAMC 26628 TaxID=1484118 RepID=UPI0007700208|nr:DUF4097 family beta strand repeat-containing protein [Hymenobacter sp. PAMC 26628]AMJ66819.1 hypothetical protein AXW84_16340 [Hymenobacter sp. PAMC 26628]
MNRFLLAAALLLSSLAPALAQRIITQTAALGSGQGVFLDLKHAHRIRVRPGGAGLSVQATVVVNNNERNDAVSLKVEQAAAEVSVVETLDEALLRKFQFSGECNGSGNGGSTYNWNNDGNAGKGYRYCLQIDYEVTLPAGTALRLATITGDLDLQDLTGEITAKTVSGNLQFAGLSGAVTARTISGDANVAHRGPRAVNVKTVSGDVKLTTENGAATDVASVSGNVDVRWPAAEGADLSLRSVTGEVYADPAVAFSNRREHSLVGYTLKGTLGSGGPLVQIESVSGDVFFRKQ